jgi:hypothetical protein
MMKGLTGMDVYAEARRRDPARAARLVFMTGGAFTSEARAFLADRDGASVEKPFDILEDATRRMRA